MVLGKPIVVIAVLPRAVVHRPLDENGDELQGWQPLAIR